MSAIEAFVRVAEAQSFSEAARQLGKSKSVVSRQVGALESELGVRLLQRTTRSITLTEAGRGFLDRAASILSEIEDAVLSTSRLQAEPRGCLRINAPMSFGFLHLAPALPDFLERYSEIQVDLVMNDRIVDIVDEGFDLAFRIGRLTESSLVARRLAPIRMAVCASPSYLARHGIPTTPEDLGQHSCLYYSALSLTGEWRFVRPDGSPWLISVQGSMRANNGDALRAAVLKGLGLSILPTFIVGRDLQAGSLVSVLNDFVPQDLGLYAVYSHSRLLSPKVRAIIDFMAERFGHQPYWDLVE